MGNGKLYKYKSYGLIPQNEYTTSNLGKSADTAAALEVEPQAGDAVYRLRLIKLKVQHTSGRKKNSGWSRSWKANGWRAESAVLQDEVSDMGRDPTHV